MSGPRRNVLFTDSPSAHSAYEELLAHPPEGVRYVERPLRWGASLSGEPKRDWLAWRWRGLQRRFFGEPDATPLPDPGMPIHSAQGLLRTTAPWVVDFEHPNVFTGFDGDLLLRPHARDRLERLLGPCRALLPWSEAAGRATVKLLPSVADRVRVVRPAIAPRPRAVEDPEKPLVLFVGRHFRRKGGVEALEAFARAREERCPTARMLMVSNAPEDIVRRYTPLGVTFLPPTQPRERVLREGFARASVYLMPTHFDTFGMVFLEAFAHGVPVVTTETFAADEIVSHGRDGFVVPGYSVRWHDEDGLPRPGTWRWESLRAALPEEERPALVRRLADALGDLLGDAEKRRSLAERAYETVATGRFSLEERNARLLAAYEEAFSS